MLSNSRLATPVEVGGGGAVSPVALESAAVRSGGAAGAKEGHPTDEAAGDQAGYFIVEAGTPVEVRTAGRRLAGPLRMPGFPGWVNE